MPADDVPSTCTPIDSARPSLRVDHRRILRILPAPVLAILLLATACGAGSDPVPRAVERHFGTPRPVEPRLSVLPRHARCTGDAALCTEAKPGGGDALVEAAARLRRSAGSDAGPGSGARPTAREDAAAVALELVSAVAAGTRVDLSVSMLEDALDRHPMDAALRSDLAAAYLVRSRITGRSAEALRVIEVASQVLDREPDHAAARFNRALALERFGLLRTAGREWSAYGEAEEGTGWSREASERAAALEDSLMGITAKTARDPQTARLLAQDSLLPAWGAAVVMGDEGAARGALDRARRIGEELAAGGDGSVAAMVAEADDDRSRVLARVHAVYGRARRAYAAGSYDVARTLFEEAETALAAAPPGAATAVSGWTDFYRAATIMYDGRMDEARRRLESLAERTDATRFPALAGRAHWGLGSIALRAGRFAEARDRFGRAAALFEGAGETVNLGATRSLTAETGMALGQAWTGVDTVAAALAALNRAGPSVWLHNLLYAGASHALALGLPRAALALQDEGVAVASQLGPLYRAEARLARARLRHQVGRAGARDDLRHADLLYDSLTDAGARAWIANDRRHTAALLGLAGGPGPAADSLAVVAAFFRDVGSAPREAGALLDRAHALEAAGRLAEYRATLDDVLRIAESQIRAAPGVPLRATLARTVQSAVSRAVAHDLEAGDPRSALAALRRWSGARVDGHPPPARADAVGSVGRSDPGTLELAYQLLDDGVAILVGHGGSVAGLTVPIAPERLETLVAAVIRAGDRGAAEASVRPHLAELYEILVGPIAPDAGWPPQLRVYADGLLASVPFAALYDESAGRYLAEAVVVSHTPLPGTGRGPRPVRPRRALAVAADRFDTGDRGLPWLPLARAEARDVAGAYPAAAVLAGRDATAAALARAARDADILHFAGHAVLDTERPWRSHLVLAPDSVNPAGELTVPALIDAFRHLSMVVLASCRSASPDDRLAEGFAGIADALTAAGVGATVGAVWDVADDETAALLVPFHRGLAHGRDPAEALRDAQLTMIRSDDPRRRSPAAWAAYRVMTR